MAYAYFCLLVQKDAVVTVAISGLTGPILIKFAYDLATILPLNIFESKLPYSYPFRNTSLLNKVIFCQFCPKLVAMATSFEELAKVVQIDHLRTNNYYLVQRSRKLDQWILR